MHLQGRVYHQARVSALNKLTRFVFFNQKDCIFWKIFFYQKKNDRLNQRRRKDLLNTKEHEEEMIWQQERQVRKKLQNTKSSGEKYNNAQTRKKRNFFQDLLCQWQQTRQSSRCLFRPCIIYFLFLNFSVECGFQRQYFSVHSGARRSDFLNNQNTLERCKRRFQLFFLLQRVCSYKIS